MPHFPQSIQAGSIGLESIPTPGISERKQIGL
jgi:hypothetical protein